MTLFHLVRHGETLWHAENRYAGTADVALTPRGLEQAVDLAGWVERRVTDGARFDAVVTSTLSRAVLTARPACQVLGLEAQQDARLGEMAFGQGEGMTRAEMMVAFPEVISAFLANPAEAAITGGETGREVASRARAALEDVARERPDGTVLVVGHSTLTRVLLADLLGTDLARYRALFPAVGNCHVTSFELSPDGDFALHAYNVPPTA